VSGTKDLVRISYDLSVPTLSIRIDWVVLYGLCWLALAFFALRQRGILARQSLRLRLNSVNVRIPLLGGGVLEGTLVPDERQRTAAWELYVELVTRVAVVNLKP